MYLYIMKRIILSILLFGGLIVAVRAQAVQDSVKIRLETSPGCEIGIDGEISSTNVMTQKVAVGHHEVTVTFGTAFSKTYPIEVTTTGESKFTFPISGTLSITSTPPGADIFVDGLRVAKSPATVDVLGSHNIRLSHNEEIWQPKSERVTVYPFANEQMNFVLKKQPPKFYGMMLVNYGLQENSIGFMLGVCRRFGWFLRGQGIIGSGVNTLDAESDNYSNNGYDKLDDPYLALFSTGLMYRCSRHLFLYGGGGYGDYNHGDYKDNGIFPYYATGAAIDFGAILKWKALLLSCGYNTIVGDVTEGHRYGNVYVGLGFTIHRNKKK